MRGLRFVLGVVVVVVCLLVVGGGVALAVPASFGSGEGDESGQFQRPRGIAVDQESGDVYVADVGNQRVDKFGPAGEFLFAWGWGVADGHTEAPQTCTTECFVGMSGSGGGELSPEGVAVDSGLLSASHGDVYVRDSANDRVEKFDSSGSFLLAFGKEVNATTSGDVCLAGEACRAGTSGTEPGEFQMGETGGVAVDASGDVFVGDVNRVEEFTQGGVYVGQVAIAGAGAVKALAVDAGGDVYVQASELAGVHEYEASGAEVGAPRDATGSFVYFARDFLALGSSGELFVAESSEGGVSHIREYDSSSGEVASFDRVSGGVESDERGIAFNQVAGALDVLDRGRVRVVGVPAAGPLIVSATGEEARPTSVAVDGLVNPESHETSYRVEYGTSASYGSSTTPVTLGGSEFEDEPMSVPLVGLQPSTTYHFRVVASSSAGTAFGEDQTFATLPPASIDSESASAVTATGATLAGRINPLGRDTSYRFEYGTTTAYGTSVPVPDGDAGSGTSDVSVSALVEGLSPSVTYHYRVVASNVLGVADGPDRVFVTQGGEAPVLPDGRAWEMVSPPEKRGWTLLGIGGAGGGGALVQAAADGSAVTYAAAGPIEAEPKGNRNPALSQVFSSRAASGWSWLDIATPHETVVGGIFQPSEYLTFSPDLSVGLVEPLGDTPLSPQATEHTPYRRAPGGEYTPLVDAGNVPPGTQFGQLEESGYIKPGDATFRGASPDLSHVILESSPPLTDGIAAPASQAQSNLFEWAGGSLRLVSVLPNGKAATEEEVVATLGEYPNVRHAVSDDGSRVIWEAHKGEFQGSLLYVRDVARGETVRLDAVEAGARGGEENPAFVDASSDGSKVFFTDNSRLTLGATAGRNLYMCALVEVAGKLRCQLKDLTVDHNAGESAGVQGAAIGAGEDGRYVYFAAGGVLAAGATPGNCNPGGAGVCNLYVYDTVRGEVKLVAQLSDGDYPDWQAPNGSYLEFLTAGVSPDGRYLAFMSERSLTGYDNLDARSGQPDVEVFLYDAGTGRLVCASCNPSGARPSGVFDSGEYPGLLADRPGNWHGHWLAGSIPSWTNVNPTRPTYYLSRYLSNDGRLFFDGADSLAPGDANGTGDVYEYEPPRGEGTPASDTCTVGSPRYSAVSGGCVGLISAGTSGEESAFLDASESGDDVFFLTSSRLVPQDLDQSFDVYDARVCTPGSPCLAAPAAPPVPCGTADSCRAAPSSQPGVFGAPPSATFSGAGNPTTGAAGPVAKRRVLSVAQKRAAALRKCRGGPRRKRASCEAQARRRYRVGVKAKRSGGSPHGKRGR